MKKGMTNNKPELQDIISNFDNKLNTLVAAFGDLKDNLKKTGLQSSKNQYAVEENTIVAKELEKKIVDTNKAIDELLIDQRQTNAKLRRELEDWQKVAVEYLEAMERSICLLAVSQTTDKQIHEKQMAEKAVSIFLKLSRSLGLDKIDPLPGDSFDDRLHEGYQEVESETVPDGHIVISEAWGYRIGAQIIKRARVTVARTSA